MDLRKAVAAAAGGIGLAAAGNAALARRAGDLDPPLPGTARTFRWRGMDVSYTEAGDPGDPDVLLVHGVNAVATSREFRAAFEGLAGDYHVIAPDLPGFGLSDRPPIRYDDALYVDFVGDFAAEVAPGAACVASSLSGAYAALAGRDRSVFSRLVLVCPTPTTMPARRRWLRSLLRSPLVGTALFNLLASEASIRLFGAHHGYYDPSRRDDDEVRYQWLTGHQPGARFAPASFLSGYLDPGVDLGRTLAEAGVPVTLVWGREAETTPLSYGRSLAEAADARLVVLDRARLLPHAEHPGAFLDALAEELPRPEG